VNPVIEADRLCIRRHRVDILKDISFRVAPGDFLAVLGPNGAGKSTLLQALPALIPFEGRTTILGVDPRRLSFRALGRLRSRIGYVPQLYSRTAAVLPLSVREVVELGRVGVRGMGRSLRAGDRAICDRIMQEMQLTDISNRPFGVLSGGEQRKVHLARALAQEPEILLLDEPAGHLDFRWQEAITLLVGRLWRTSGTTIVMVTHDLRHLPPNVSQVALLGDGRLLQIGPPTEIIKAEVLSELYGLPLRVLESGGRYVAIPEESA